VSILLGCIADDFTGATDLANNLVRHGMRVAQTIGVPAKSLDAEFDCVVVALKSRTISPEEAIRQSLDALDWLLEQGAQQIYFKYCSTFDSTDKGNIGPVTEALMKALKTDFTIATPAFPDNGRTVFKGHLFVGDMLLSESSMRNHPLTPMTDANLKRVLQAQSQGLVGLIDYQVIAKGTEAIHSRVKELKAANVSIAIVDAISNEDLYRMGPAFKDLPLVTGGSGLAIGLPKNFAIEADSRASTLPPASGYEAILSGSCSEVSNQQVAHFIQLGGLAYAINPIDLIAKEKGVHGVVSNVLAWAKPLLPLGPLLIYSTASPDKVKLAQAELGVDAAGAAIENTLAMIAAELVHLGVGKLIIAGGETSGACVRALGIEQMQIGPQIDSGVPWCHAQVNERSLHLALKSGNFGDNTFFTKAFSVLREQK
jgi:3-dehydrotetronate 4-kinase